MGKHIDIAGLNYTQIATIPFATTYGGTVSSRPYACFVNGRFALVYACGDYNSRQTTRVVVYVIDTNGDMCTFMSYGFDYGPIDTLARGVYQVGNSFTASSWWGSADVHFKIPDVFVPGATFHFPLITQPIPASPCGGGTFRAMSYLQKQGIIAYEYLQTFSQANNTWASVYDLNGAFIGGGFIGNFPAAQDGFNKFSQTLPPYVDGNSVFFKDGYYVYNNFGSTGGDSQVYGASQPFLYGDPKTLVCGLANPNVYVGSKNVTSFHTADLGLYFYGSPYDILSGTSDVDQIFCNPNCNTNGNATPRIGIFYGDSIATVERPGGISFGAAMRASKKELYICIQNPSHWAGPVYMAAFDPAANNITPPSPPASITQSAHSGLINMHRPISINGKYLT